MRRITTHQTNVCNNAITIEAEDRDPETGRCSSYRLHWLERVQSYAFSHPNNMLVHFQNGPIDETGGNNGITIEVLLALAIDQLEGHQSAKYANNYNAAALELVKNALAVLEERTREREARGVEGTHKV